VDPLDVHLSVITLGEVMRGIALKQKSDPRTAGHLTEWLQKLRRDHADRILPITDQVAVEWGRVAALRPRGDADGLIAATAIIHDLIIVTRNVDDFNDVGVSVISPWEVGRQP
jgi:predicted nucleic acid-binding protein